MYGYYEKLLLYQQKQINMQVKMFSDTADDLCTFYKECCRLMKKHPTSVTKLTKVLNFTGIV